MADVRPAGIPADTSIEMWTLQMKALRRRTPEQRSRSWDEFQTEMDAAQRLAIVRKYPALDDRTVTALLVKRRHGADLARAAFPEIDLSELR